MCVLQIILIGSIPIASVACVNYTLAQMYAAPPYNLDPTHLGYMYVGPLVGSLLVTGFSLFTSDPLAIWMARRNNGIFEVSIKAPPVSLVSLLFYFANTS